MNEEGQVANKAHHKHGPHIYEEGQWHMHIEIASLFIESKQGGDPTKNERKHKS